jgi:TetR/AcrR family transcriptional repressor of mexCD-oprJ operon
MHPPAARQALQQRVADAILDGAAQVLVARGPGASMSDVAAAAGVARATVYRYFPNRDALLEELASLALRDARERLAWARLEELPPEEALTRVVRALVEVGDPFVLLARARGRPQEFEATLSEPIGRLFERGRDVGDIRDDLPVGWLTEALLGLVVNVLATPPVRGREDAVAAITSLFLDGARRRGPRPA